MANTPNNSWPSRSFRFNFIYDIINAICLSENPTQIEIRKMETYIFQKSKNKEEYLGYVARLIINICEMCFVNSINGSEEDSILEKRKQLAEFAEPFKRLLFSQRENKKFGKMCLWQMEVCYDILTNPNRRCSMTILNRIEETLKIYKPVFEIMEDMAPYSQPTAVPLKSQEQNICHPLVNTLNNLSNTPMFKDIAEKTFGPPITALFGSNIRTSSLHCMKLETDDDFVEISEILRSEIAQLDKKFKVSLDPVQSQESKTVSLTCQLVDEKWPHLPSINVTVPKNYPEEPPKFYIKDEYNSPSILQSLQRTICTMLSMPQKYSFTTLLDTWEESVHLIYPSRPVYVGA